MRAWPRKPRKPKAPVVGLVEALSAPPQGAAVLDLLGALEKSLGKPEQKAAEDAAVEAAIADLAPGSVEFGRIVHVTGGCEALRFPLAVDERPAILRRAHGLHSDVDGDEYYARTPGIASKSALDLVRQAPARYQAWLTASAPDRSTPALAFGQALHCALLEPERFAVAYAVQPKTDGRTKEGQEARARWLEDHPGAKPLSEEDALTIRGMVRAVLEHELAAALLVDGAAEVTARWRDAGSGVECKGRADYWSESIGAIVDLKSCEDASPAEFRRAMASYGLHRQAAMYLDGWRAAGAPAENFVLLAVEKTPPYLVGLYEPTYDAVVKGRSSIREDLETMARCLDSGIWPGYSAEIEPLDLPRWASW